MKRVLLILIAALSLASHAIAAKPPNIVLIISDDQSWTDYSFMGHEAIETPNIDRLAKQSRLFKRGYVPSSLCCPSLASMITGLYPHQTKITGNEPPMPPEGRNSEQYRKQVQECVSFIDDLPTLPRLLAKRGYVSHQSGKWWQGHYSRGGFSHGMTHGDPKRGGRHGDVGLKIGREGMDEIFDFIEDAGDKPFFVDYSFREESDAICRALFERAMQASPLFEVKFRQTSAQGRLDGAELRERLGRFDDAYIYICGPEQFNRQLERTLREELDVPPERIFIEEFSHVGGPGRSSS